MKTKVLVVDDEADIVELLRYNLVRAGYDVISARNGEEALEKAASMPDLIILDLMMPVLDGYETCRRLKSNPGTHNIPVVFLTARSGEADEILGLELGGDDYIQKPIGPRKLIARVKAILRRAESGGQDDAGGLIRAGLLEINRGNYSVKLAGKDLFLPKKEFSLLALLASHRGRVYSRAQLLNEVWGSDVVVGDRTVDVHIRKIREKLGNDADLIETIKGVGYRFRE